MQIADDVLGLPCVRLSLEGSVGSLHVVKTFALVEFAFFLGHLHLQLLVFGAIQLQGFLKGSNLFNLDGQFHDASLVVEFDGLHLLQFVLLLDIEFFLKKLKFALVEYSVIITRCGLAADFDHFLFAASHCELKLLLQFVDQLVVAHDLHLQAVYRHFGVLVLLETALVFLLVGLVLLGEVGVRIGQFLDLAVQLHDVSLQG